MQEQACCRRPVWSAPPAEGQQARANQCVFPRTATPRQHNDLLHGSNRCCIANSSIGTNAHGLQSLQEIIVAELVATARRCGCRAMHHPRASWSTSKVILRAMLVSAPPGASSRRRKTVIRRSKRLGSGRSGVIASHLAACTSAMSRCRYPAVSKSVAQRRCQPRSSSSPGAECRYRPACRGS